MVAWRHRRYPNGGNQNTIIEFPAVATRDVNSMPGFPWAKGAGIYASRRVKVVAMRFDKRACIQTHVGACSVKQVMARSAWAFVTRSEMNYVLFIAASHPMARCGSDFAAGNQEERQRPDWIILLAHDTERAATSRWRWVKPSAD